MIIEGIVTTLNSNGELNIAPMGPIVDESWSTLILRPFQSSMTYRNLKERPSGVFHIVDDVLLIAQAALDRLVELPATIPATRIHGQVLRDCCRWYEFTLTNLDDSSDRTSISAKVVYQGSMREMSGFNRAKYAVIEATILATRLHLISESEIQSQLKSLSTIVEKTAGSQEREAFSLVQKYVGEWLQRTKSPSTIQ